jgi:hypothetical protein
MGRWFTDSEQEAMGYGGNLRYVDVTPQEAQALKYGPMPGAEESASQFLVTPEVRAASQPRGHSAEWLAERNRKLGIKVPTSTPRPASSDVHGELEQWMLEKRTAGALHDEARVAAQPKLSYKEALALEPGLSFGQRGPAGPSFPYSKETEDVAQLINTLRAKNLNDDQILAYVRNLRNAN